MSCLIERITTRVVSVPLAEPIVNPFLGSRTQFATLLVQVHTSDGLVGLGYASIESVRMVKAVNEIVRDLEQLIKGTDALRRAFIYERMWRSTVDLLHDGAVNLALAAIDVALWDICGKQAGQPLWKLLGGFRDKQPVYASWTLWRHQDNDTLQSEAAMLVERGHRAMKLRLGGGRKLSEDRERAALVRKVVGPDVAILVDALWGSTATEGVAMARMLGELDYAWLEEPVREGDFGGLAHVRAAQALPIAAGERISRTALLNDMLPAVDHVILDAHHLGGVTPWMKAATIVETHNLPISTHSHPLVHMHLLASVRTGAWVEYMPWWDVLFSNPPQPRDGALPLGDAPGLGLELDEDAIRRFAVN